MRNKTFFQTFLSRILILIFNFVLVIYTTNVWGSEGKGVISLVIANLTIVGFFSNIFVGSSVSFFASRYKKEEILMYSYLWSIFIGLLVPFLFAIFHSSDYLLQLIALSISSSMLTANINFFVGKKNLKAYNYFTVFQQALHLFLILFIILIFHTKSVEVYFNAQILTYAILFSISLLFLFKDFKSANLRFSKEVRNSLLEYGWKTQLSSFIQFLNYRLSYYFLEFYKGINSVGIFSIGVAFSEAIWTVSRSISVVLYSEIINDENESVEKTKLSLRISFLISTLCLFILLLLPTHFYTLVFGKAFFQTKTIILLLSPGILAIATSNILGFYFAGVRQLRILNIKSFFGLLVTLFASLYAIPKWGIFGACVVTSVSYVISSIVLFWKFYIITDFHFTDFIITRQEIALLIKKILPKK